jgi:RNA polymerase sigma-70 factor (ECF subfamily)
MDKTTINKIANKIREDDLASYKKIFDYLYYDICVNINSILYDFEVSRDLTQELFISLWEDRSKMPKFLDFKSYMYKLSKNKALNYLKSKNLRDNYSAVLYEKKSTNTFDFPAKIEETELSSIIDTCLDTFPEKTKMILKLNKSEMKKQKEVAEIMGVSVKTVEAHIAFAKKEIKKTIKNYYLK